MKVLQVHNYYIHRGGEAGVFHKEIALLRDNGHQVITYTCDNSVIKKFSIGKKILFPLSTLYSIRHYREVEKIIKKESPDIAHFHNTFPLISPSVYDACNKFGVPVVQTLHNYRLICPSGMLLRDNQICELCIGRSFQWPGVLYKCYRGSRSQSMVAALVIAFHRLISTWEQKVDAYIALTEFSKSKFVEGGLSENKIFVKPNFVSDPSARNTAEDYVVYIGRLSEEKGIDLLIKAISRTPQIKLKIIGDGPLRPWLEQQKNSHSLQNVEILGWLENETVLSIMEKSKFLVLPSRTYEGFPLVLVEAMASGTPAIVANIGAMKELIVNGYNGTHFQHNNADDLSKKIQHLYNSPLSVEKYGVNARKEFEDKYTPERNYKKLMEIYDFVKFLK